MNLLPKGSLCEVCKKPLESYKCIMVVDLEGVKHGFCSVACFIKYLETKDFTDEDIVKTLKTMKKYKDTLVLLRRKRERYGG